MNLNHITLPTVDLERSIEFYKLMGFELIVKFLPHYARFECPDGSSSFSVHLTKELPAGDGIWVYFECPNVDHSVKRLKHKGVKIDQEPEDKSWMWREARLKDPDGNQIILFHGGVNRLNPPWRIG